MSRGTAAPFDSIKAVPFSPIGEQTTMTVKPILAALLVAATACGTSAETERKLADLEQANSQRDSLLQEVAVSARLLSDVSTALSKVHVRGRAIRTSSETRGRARAPSRARCSRRSAAG